eukprot:365808-Chlamydomonas_euryale.AAC.10
MKRGREEPSGAAGVMKRPARCEGLRFRSEGEHGGASSGSTRPPLVVLYCIAPRAPRSPSLAECRRWSLGD